MIAYIRKHWRKRAIANQHHRRMVIPDAVRASVDDYGLVLFHMTRGFLYRANSTGTRIWEGIAKGQDLRDLTQELCREFNVPQDEVNRDISTFLAELTQLGLVEVPA